MAANSQQPPKGRNDALSSLKVAIDTLNLAKEATGAAPAKAAFSSVSDLLTIIGVSFLLARVTRFLVNVSRTQ